MRRNLPLSRTSLHSSRTGNAATFSMCGGMLRTEIGKLLIMNEENSSKTGTFISYGVFMMTYL